MVASKRVITRGQPALNERADRRVSDKNPVFMHTYR
jgi:hypothetical protein